MVRLKQEVSKHSTSHVELETELTSNRDKAVELLTHSEKMATRNAELQSEMSALEIKVQCSLPDVILIYYINGLRQSHLHVHVIYV